MKLNLGCGNHKVEGYVNVDMFPECAPDVVCDLEATPWPWETDSVKEVLFHHSLEHMGGSPKVFFAIIKELYRICANGCTIQINVPHPRHDNFINDPTHVRAITPQLLTLFDKRLNEEWKRTKAANSPLALYLGVNFEVTNVMYTIDEPYLSLYKSKQMSDEELFKMMKERNNVVNEYQIKMKAIK